MDLASLPTETPEVPQDTPVLAAGWSNEDFLKLLQMYNDGCKPTTMAQHFRKTRGQIAGLLWRSQKKGLIEPKPKLLTVVKPKPVIDPAAIAAKVAANQLLKNLLVKKVKKLRRVRLRLIDDTRTVTFAELEPHHCRWGIGDPRQSDFRFCGCRRVLQKPYCEEHVIKAGRLYDGTSPFVRKVYPSYIRR